MPADRFVIDQWRSLLPTAYLLTGTDAAARQLLARGLAAGRGASEDRALVGLVRAHLGRWQLRREVAITDTTTAAWWASAADAEAARRLSAALDRLTPAQRTAVVLRWHEGLDAVRVAELVPDVDSDAAAHELAGEVPEVADLPARLEGMAAQCDLTALTDETAVAAVAGVGAQRRRRALLAVGVVAALVVGAVLVGTQGAPRVGPQARPDSDAPATQSLPDFAAGPTRGSLATDQDFLDQVRQQAVPAWRDAPIVFAGDVQGLRAVLLVRESAGRPETYWLTGPAGARVAALDGSADTSAPGVRAAAVAGASSTPDAAVALVVTARGDDVEISPGVDVAADGSLLRSFQPVPTSDGVAVLLLDRGGAQAARYRVVRDGSVLEEVDVQSVSVGEFYSAEDEQPSEPSRSGVPDASGFGYSQAIATITRSTGFTADDLTVTVLGAGSFPAPGGDTVEAVTLAAVLPSGAVVTTTGFGSIVSTASSMMVSWSGCGSTGYPAGTDPATLTVVARCSSYAADSSTFGVTLIVAAPPSATVTLDTAAGGSPAVPELDNGWAYVIDAADDLTQYAVDGALGTVSRDGADLFTS